MPVHARVSCEIMLASVCNMSCIYCLAGDSPRSKMDRATAKKAIELFLYLSEGATDLEMVFTGGEPLLNQEVLLLLLEYTTELAELSGIRTSFVLKTNGTLLNRRLLDYLRAFHVRTVVSIDGSPESHNSYRVLPRGRPTQARVMQNLRRLIKAEIEYVASMTVHPNLSRRITANIKYLFDSGIRCIDFGPAYGTVDWSNTQAKAFSAAMQKVAQIIRKAAERGVVLQVGPLYKNSEHQNGMLANVWGCHAASSHLAFLPDGTISGCSSLAMLASRFPNLIIGNVERGIDDTRLQHLLKQAQGSIADRPACTECSASDNCYGGCLAINLAETGYPRRLPFFYCECMRSLPGAIASAWD